MRVDDSPDVCPTNLGLIEGDIGKVGWRVRFPAARRTSRSQDQPCCCKGRKDDGDRQHHVEDASAGEPHKTIDDGRGHASLSSNSFGDPRLCRAGLRALGCAQRFTLNPLEGATSSTAHPLEKCRFAKARPEPDLRYFSKRNAALSDGNSIETAIDRGRCARV